MSASSAPAPRRSRSRRTAVVLVVVLVLLAVAAVVADFLVRRGVADTAATIVREAHDLPADHPDDVVLDELTGDVSLVLRGVPASGSGALDSGTATTALDADSVTDLISERSTVPIDSVELDPPLVRVSTSVEVLGLSLSAGVGLELGAVDGQIELTPSEVTVAGATFPADDAEQRFGGLTDGLLGPGTLCIADSVARGLTLTDVEVAEESLNATFSLAPTFLSDPAQQEPGVCP